jgi:ferredoxin
VCPTGIDIRNGTQMECIGCANCIDACDEVMDKVKQPRGLIRYASQNQLEGTNPRFFRARTDQVLPAGARSDALPDLVVRWSDAPAATHRALRSPALGTIAWPTPGRHPDGRSGNHRPEGFLIAAGPELPQGSEAPAGHILDLAPSIRALLGLPPDPAMRGRSLAGAAPVA